MAKRTNKRVSDAKRLRGEGRSYRVIAEELSQNGLRVTEGTIRNWLGKDGEPAEPAPAPPAPPPPVPLDDSELPPDFVEKTLAGLLRRERAREEHFTAAGDLAAAQRSGRLAGQLAGQLAKLQGKDDDDGEVVRVKAGDIDAAAQRALSSLSQTADRVVAERATWPRCSTCGQPCGEFSAADKSPVRSMFERVVSI